MQCDHHAGWMRVLAENGFIGFLVLAAYAVSFAIVGLGRHNRTQRNLGVLATLAMTISLITTEFHLKGLFFLMVGVTVCLHVAHETAPALASSRRWRRSPTLTVQPNRMDVH